MRKFTRRVPSAKKIAFLALTTSFALISFLLEQLLPALPLPGAKIGLSNIFTLLPLIYYGLGEALLVVIAKTVLGSIFAGNLSLLLYSLTAGIISTLIARLFFFLVPKISLVCVSVVSAVCHNLTQLFVYCLLTKTALLFVYSPYLVLMGMGAGAAVGIIVVLTLNALPLVTPANAFRSKPDKSKAEVS